MVQKKRLQPDDWLRAALVVLGTKGVGSVRVERLAVQLGVTKGSFYWHFEDRAALLSAMLKKWEDEATHQVIVQVESTSGSAEARLQKLITVAFNSKSAASIENAIRAWGRHDKRARSVLRRVDSTRLEYVAGLLRSCGRTPKEARTRARILYLVMIGEFTWNAHGEEKSNVQVLRTLQRMLVT